MDYTPIIVPIVVAILGSGGLFSLIQYLITRHDGKNGTVERIETKIDKLSKDISSVQFENCKNYVVNFLSKVEAGDKITDDALLRFYENYDMYEKMNGNSYVHEWVDRLKAEGLLVHSTGRSRNNNKRKE